MNRIVVTLSLSLGILAHAKTESLQPVAPLFHSVWRDVSTTEDGISPAQCTDSRKHCIFQAVGSRQYWAAVNLKDATTGLGELKDHQSAVEACKSIQNWGGYSDWRLPTISEMHHSYSWVKQLIQNLSSLPGYTDSANWDEESYLWTATRIALNARQTLEEQDPDKAWAYSFVHPWRSLDRSAPLTWLCTRDDTSKFWDDKSTLADGKTPTQCSQDSDQCLFEDKRTGLLWTEISPGQNDRDADSDHLVYASVADALCKSLTWAGGHGGFRAPKVEELEKAHHNGLHALSLQYEPFGVKGDLWSRSRVRNWDCRDDWDDVSFNVAHSASGDYKALGEKHPNATGRCLLPERGHTDLLPMLPWVCVKSVNDPLVPPAPPPPPPPADDDEDGVPNSEDQCPNTKPGAKAWKAGQKTKTGAPIDLKFIGCAKGQVPEVLKKVEPPGKKFSSRSSGPSRSSEIFYLPGSERWGR